MNYNIQKEKIINKFALLENHIKDLIEYNNLTDYDNIKKFTIKVNYYKDLIKNSYNYNIFILRGTNHPEKTLSVRFNSEDKINDLIENLIKQLFKNEYLSYSSFNKNFTDINKYILNFKNDVNVEFYIKDKSDKEFYETIDKKYINDSVISSFTDITLNTEKKDELQKIKAIKVINNIDNIFSNIININNIENYENIKPYKLQIQSKYNDIRECFIYNFNIIRGNINPEKIVEYSLSIKDNDIVLKKLNIILTKYIESEDLLYKSTYNEFKMIKYLINLKNYITIELDTNNDKDNTFYNNLFNSSKKLVYTQK